LKDPDIVRGRMAEVKPVTATLDAIRRAIEL
jgi:hypothetical protein